MRYRTKRCSRFANWLFGTLGVVLLGIGCVGTSIYAYGNRTITTSADAAIVLGAAVWNDQPSPVFRERINHAIALYRGHKDGGKDRDNDEQFYERKICWARCGSG